MNPISAYLLAQCVVSDNGSLFLSSDAVLEYAHIVVGDKLNDAILAFGDEVVKCATKLGIWIL